MKDIDQYYLQLEEPTKGIFLALREFILSLDANITNDFKYKMPFFCYNGKMFCYLWKDKTTQQPYIGIVEGNAINHPLLEQGNRARMKILRINPKEDLPIENITEIFNQLLIFYK